MKISISGLYQTQFGELWDQSLEDLISKAANGCLKDSGITISQVQSVFIGNMLGGVNENKQHLSSLVSQLLKTQVPVTRVESACASGGMALRLAIQAINSGDIDNALVVGAEKMTDLSACDISKALMGAASAEERTADLTFPGLYALLARAYFHQFQASERDLAKVAVKNHFHATFNPKAQFRFPITADQVLSSTKVADPLKLLDCSPITDGAAAIFIATPKWLKAHHLKNSVYISGSAQAQDSLSLSHRTSLTSLSATKLAAHKAYAQAGITPKDIDLVEVHDCFTIAEILALEDLDIYPKGEAYAHINKKESYLGGKKPVNTSGGLKACGHPVAATGIKQVIEATLQLRQQAGNRQVKAPKVAVTQNIGGTGGTAIVHVLIR